MTGTSMVRRNIFLRPVRQVIYRIYFAMPKIPEFATQHNCCDAKYFGIDSALGLLSVPVARGGDRFDHPCLEQARFDRARIAKFPPTRAAPIIKRSSCASAARDLKMPPRPEKIAALSSVAGGRTTPTRRLPPAPARSSAAVGRNPGGAAQSHGKIFSRPILEHG